jgi:hypothetical protein
LQQIFLRPFFSQIKLSFALHARAGLVKATTLTGKSLTGLVKATTLTGKSLTALVKMSTEPRA